MAEIFKFFNSAPGDERWHYASDFADYFGSVLSDGILHTDKQTDLGLRVRVVPNTLTTKVAAGKAIIKGYAYENTTELILKHDIPEPTLKRIDRIVLRLDLSNSSRYVKLFVKKGASATSPIAPTLQRDQYIHELSLAQVLVRENTTQLIETDLKDERMIESLCGLVSSIISVPTTQFQEQWDKWFESVKNEGFAPYADTGFKQNLKTTDKTTIVGAVNELKEDYVRSPGYATATGTNAYAVTLNPAPIVYKDGMGLVIKINTASTGATTINVNGLGAKPILKANGTAMTDFKAGVVYSLRYNGTNFYLQGEGGNEKEIFRNVGKILATTMYRQQLKYMNDDYYFTSESFNKPDYGIEYYFRKYTRTNATLIKTTVFNKNTHPNGDFPNNTSYKVNYSEFGIISKNKAFDENGTLLISFNYEPTCFGANASEFVYLNGKSMELRNSSGGTLLRTIATETRSNITFRECLVRKEMSDFYLNIIKFSYTEPSVRLQLKNFTGPDSDGGEYIRAENIVNSSMIIT